MQWFYLISASFHPHSYFQHYYLSLSLSISLWLCSLLVIQCHSAAGKYLPCAMWWQSFKVITWARCRRRRRRVVVRSNCSSILFGAVTVNATATSCPPFLHPTSSSRLSPSVRCRVVDSPTQCQVPHCQHFISLFACFAIFFIVPYNQFKVATRRVYKTEGARCT